MSNVIRGSASEGFVEIPLQVGFSPERHEQHEKHRLDLHDKLLKEAREKTRRIKEDGERSVREASAEAESILVRAREEAAALVAGARKERAAIEAEARTAGRTKAAEDARTESLGRIAESLATLDRAAADLRAMKAEYVSSSVDCMIEIISASLRKILRAEIDLDRGLITRTIEAAFSELLGADRIRVRINPHDVAAVEEMREEIMRAVKGLAAIELVEDTGITRGGTLIETSFGRVDARLESQIEELLRDIRLRTASIDVTAEGSADSDSPAGA